MAHDEIPIFLATFYTDKTRGQYGLGRLNDVGRAIGAVQAYHRSNLPQDGEAPYAVANEFISSELGRLVGLPIPPGALTRSTPRSSEILFSCLDFECVYGTLVNAEPDRCCSNLLEDCTGLVLFDMIIANPDREAYNLKSDDPLRPTFIRVYDHADALFCNTGVDRFGKPPMWSGLSWPPPRRETERHFLLPYLDRGDYFHKWCYKFKSLPEFQLKNICQAARKSGLTATQATAVYEFINYRRRHIEQIVEWNKDLFPHTFFDRSRGSLI